MCSHSSLPVAPPLTSDTLLPLLKGVKSWRRLAKELIYTYEDDGQHGLLLPPLRRGCSWHVLDALQHRHGSDEESLKAVIEMFLQGKGQYEQPSWGAVLWSLYNTNEFQLAANIKSYAEPLQGMYTTDVYYHRESRGRIKLLYTCRLRLINCALSAW